MTVPYILSASRATRLSLIALILVALGSSGCRTFVDSGVEAKETSITTTLVGKITDRNGTALQAVTVTSGNATAATDQNGIFVLSNVVTASSHAFVIVKKPGYFDGAAATRPVMNGVTYLRVAMVPERSIGSIDATTGGSVGLADGTTIRLPAGGIVTQAGTPYSGAVQVFAEHLDPSQPGFAMEFPGDLSARKSDGSETILRTFGVVLAELRGTSGEVLEPASSADVELAVPIPQTLLADATASIPLWYFDERLGTWQEEGQATKQGDVFVGNVKHFTAWNCDYSGPWGTIHGRIVCGNGAPVAQAVVSIGSLSAGGLPIVITDNQGEFTARVPANWPKFELQVLASENEGQYYMNQPLKRTIPADVTTELGDIMLDSPCPSYIAGAITDCDGAPVPAIAFSSWTGGVSYTYTTNGSYWLNEPSNADVTVTASVASGKVTDPMNVRTGELGTTVAVNLVACSTANYRDIPGDYDGRIVSFSPDGSTLAVMDAGGTDLQLVNIATGAKTVLPNAIRGTDTTTYPYIRFSPDGSKLLCFSAYYANNDIEVWGTNGKRLVSALPVGWAIFNRDASAIVGCDGFEIFVFNVTTQQFDVTDVVPFPVDAVAGLTADGTKAILVSGSDLYEWNMTADQPVALCTIAGTPISSILSEDGRLTLSRDGNVLGYIDDQGLKFFSIATQSSISTKPIGVPADHSFGIAPDGKTFIAQYQPGSTNVVGLYNMSDGSMNKVLNAPLAFGTSSGVALSPDGKSAAAVYLHSIRIWDIH
jgi:hypothetical protein